MSYKSCLTCGEKFHVFKSEEQNKKYCSRKCYSLSGKKKTICGECGEELIVNKYDKRKYCSRKCFNISKKKNWYFEKECVICKTHYFPKNPKDICVTCSKICSIKLNGNKRKGITWRMSKEGKEKISHGRKSFLSVEENLKQHALNTKNSWKNISTRTKRLSDERNKKISDTQRKQFASGERIPSYPYKQSNYYKGKFFRSSWEIKFVKWCETNNIKYKYESKECRVALDNGRTYIIDFFLPEENKFVEIKGWYRENDTYKLDQAVLQNYNLIIIDKYNIDNINLNTYWKDVGKMFIDYMYDAESEMEMAQ